MVGRISVQRGGGVDGGGVAAGVAKGGSEFCRSACPSGGSLDIFVECMLPRPEMVVFGASPVACAIADLAARSGYAMTVAALAEDHDAIPDAVRRIEGLALPREAAGERFIVVATQGKRAADDLHDALAHATPSAAYVRSRRTAGVLTATLRHKGFNT